MNRGSINVKYLIKNRHDAADSGTRHACVPCGVFAWYSTSLLFKCRKYQEGNLTAVAAGEVVVPASKLAVAIKQIKELQRLLGKADDN